MNAKILIVDDDLESLKLIGLMLQAKGYQIVAAQNGPQALSKAVNEAPDLVMLDIMMPGMSGLEVCQHLRADQRTATIPVILFTAKSQLDDKVAGFEAGADDYLTKPIHPAELVIRVETLLARAARLAAPAKPTLRAKVVGFLGCKGGVGTSTLAVNVAVALAQGPAKGQEVMLAELRNGSATLALQLGLRPSKALQILAEQSVETLDADTILAHMSRHTSEVIVLSGLPAPLGTLSALGASRAEALIRNLGTLADYLLLDMGTGLNEVNQALLRLLHYLVVVVEPQRVAMLLAKNLLVSLEELEVGQHRIGIALVRKAPSATTMSKETVEGFLQHELVGVVPPAPDLAFQAAERGMPMVMLQPDTLASSQLCQLAEFIASL